YVLIDHGIFSQPFNRFILEVSRSVLSALDNHRFASRGVAADNGFFHTLAVPLFIFYVLIDHGIFSQPFNRFILEVSRSVLSALDNHRF
ncbi:hypothetical protein CQA04_27365, partial [Escherichia coli]